MKNIRNIFALNAAWSFIGEIVYFASQFLVGMVLSRILTKEDFGIVATVLILYSFLELFNDVGLKNLIVQRFEDNIIVIRKTYGVSILFGLLCTFAMVVGSPILSIVFNNHSLTYPCMTMSLCLALNSFSVIQTGVLEKRYKYKTVAICRILSAILSALVGIILALLNFGYWSLILMTLIRSFIYMILVSFVSKIIIPIFSKSYLGSLAGFCGNFSLYNICVYIFSNIDKIIISKFFGTGTLGLYNRSYTLFVVYRRIITAPLQVFYSVFFSYKGNYEKIISIYYKYLYVITIVLVPLMVIVTVCAEEITIIVWGKNWGEAAPSLAISSLAAFPVAVTSFARVLSISFNRDNVLLLFSGTYAFVAALFCLIGSIYGFNGVVCGYTLSNWVLAFLMTYYLEYKVIPYAKGMFFKLFKKVLAISIFTAAISASVKYLTSQVFGINLYMSFTINLSITLPSLLAYIMLMHYDLVEMALPLLNKIGIAKFIPILKEH